jgi:hypothetical protein
MNSLDTKAFGALFKRACLKCFGYSLQSPLTETESKLLYNQVFEKTGLTIGWKSLKNYSFFLLGDSLAKEENPSVSTLDTLARYVLEAPYSSEPERKKKEDHYPYWYRWKEKYVQENDEGSNGSGGRTLRAGIILMVLGGAVIGLTMLFRGKGLVEFSDGFRQLREDSLIARGWQVQDRDSFFWNRRRESGDGISLFTLKGDNWPDSLHAPLIRNLLIRRIPCDCWTLEIHLRKFMPRQNWQQAGVILLEDTGFTGRSMRISLSYNDYMGGGPKDREVLVQAITYLGGIYSKPEEIAHVRLFNADSLEKNPLLMRNLDHSAIRVEKQGNKYRVLFSGGPYENASFHELGSREFDMSPRYLGLFALKGFVDSSENIPALFSYFSLRCENCKP